MTSVKATLTVVLKANEVVVAEVEDAVLWQKVLTAINGGTSALTGDLEHKDTPPGGTNPNNFGKLTDTSPLATLAQQLAIDPDLVQGACAPTLEPPYLHLDLHCWEEMRKHVPQRGILAIPPIVAAATLLALWFNKAGLSNPTQAQAKLVLGTINLDDPNASRSIQNTTWLQGRSGGQFVLNPAEISKAVKLAKCFCSKDWSSWKGATSS
jgi:hypothetical protein